MTVHDPGAVEALGAELAQCDDGATAQRVLRELAADGWHLSRTPSPLDRLQAWLGAASHRQEFGGWRVSAPLDGPQTFEVCLLVRPPGEGRRTYPGTGDSLAEAMTAALDAANREEASDDDQ